MKISEALEIYVNRFL